jgi:hypothetical protein
MLRASRRVMTNVVSFAIGFSIAVILVLLCSCTVTGDLKYKTNDGKPPARAGFKSPHFNDGVPHPNWVGNMSSCERICAQV